MPDNSLGAITLKIFLKMFLRALRKLRFRLYLAQRLRNSIGLHGRTDRNMTQQFPASRGVLLKDALYTPDGLTEAIGLPVPTQRQWRKDGLPSMRIGKRVYFLGRDVMDFIVSNSEGATKNV